MLDEKQRREAFGILWSHWRDGRRLAELPDAVRPRTRRDGYAIQALLESEAGQRIAGWKLAATSNEGQKHIVVDGPLAGRLPASHVVGDGARVALGASLMRVAEVEFVFRLGRDLPPRDKPYGVDEVMDSVAALHLGIELPDSRYENFTIVGAAQLIADAACANRFVLGAPAPPLWRDLDLAKHVVKGAVIGKHEFVGSGGNVLGDPRVAMTWLANELAEIGASLKAGEFVTTGTCVKPMPVEPGDEATGDFGALGKVSVKLS